MSLLKKKKNAIQPINVVSFIKQGRVVLNTNNNFVTIYFSLPVSAESSYTLGKDLIMNFKVLQKVFFSCLCWVAYIHQIFYRPFTLFVHLLTIRKPYYKQLGDISFQCSPGYKWSWILWHIICPQWRCIKYQQDATGTQLVIFKINNVLQLTLNYSQICFFPEQFPGSSSKPSHLMLALIC